MTILFTHDTMYVELWKYDQNTGAFVRVNRGA